MPKRTDIPKTSMMYAIGLAIVFGGIQANAETCEVRPPVSAPKVCGRVSYDDGKTIENIELQLVRNENQVVAKAQTNSSGEFMFQMIDKGDYHLVISRSGNWAGGKWPVKVTKSGISKVCKRPIYVVLSPHIQLYCHSWITTKRPKFE